MEILLGVFELGRAREETVKIIWNDSINSSHVEAR